MRKFEKVSYDKSGILLNETRAGGIWGQENKKVQL